jgi:L-rhamnose mutarotase
MKSILTPFILLVLVAFGICGCVSTTKSTPQRYVWATGLNPDKADYYEELHAKPWPSISKKITACNIQNMSIHKREIEGKLYLFLYLEYVGDDFEADMAAMAADPEIQRWWKETDPCQIPLPDAAAKGSIWSDTTEVFYQP